MYQIMRQSPSQSVDDICHLNNILKLPLIHQCFTLIKFKKYMSDKRFFLCNEIQSVQPIHSHNTRFTSNNNYSIPVFSLSKYYSSFMHQSVQYHNQLPVDLKNVINSSKFKNLSRKFLSP